MAIEPAEQPAILGAVLDEAVAVLDALGVRYMLIGGLAVGVRAIPRATNDIDLSIAADAEATRGIADAMQARGFAVRSHGPPGEGAILRFLKVGPDGIARWIDMLCASTPFEVDALGRASPATLFARSLPIASVEDLLVFKLLAGRPQDRADFVALVRANADAIDEAYLSARAAEWESSEALAALLREARER